MRALNTTTQLLFLSLSAIRSTRVPNWHLGWLVNCRRTGGRGGEGRGGEGRGGEGRGGEGRGGEGGREGGREGGEGREAGREGRGGREGGERGRGREDEYTHTHTHPKGITPKIRYCTDGCTIIHLGPTCLPTGKLSTPFFSTW